VWLCTATALTQQPASGAHGLSYVAAEQQHESIDGSANGVYKDNIPKRLEMLNLLSDGLLEKAGSGSTLANDFRIEARLYRELLRQLMLENRAVSPAKRVPETLFLEMVRMSALLHAAADCKTGKFITCPPDLMIQLKSQQTAVSEAFADVFPAQQRETP